MIAMKFTIEPDIGLSVLLEAALPLLVTDRETKTHRRGRSKRSYGHCRRRIEIPEAEPQIGRVGSSLASRGLIEIVSQGIPCGTNRSRLRCRVGSSRHRRFRCRDAACRRWKMQPVYEAAGGADGLLRLAGAWHARVMADEVVSHAFSHGFHPEGVCALGPHRGC